MMRLVRNGLMFGNLIEVNSAALVGRYNRALDHLIGKTTALTEFHIDISGYSPEIGHELGDELYLNPQGCNRMFIMLTTDQKSAPLLESNFSTSRSILKHYIEENESELFALTAREAVAGELMNSVFVMKTPSDLLHINSVEVQADTIQAHVAEAGQLSAQIDRFMGEEDAWWDDVLISDMIELAKRTGNIHRNPVELKNQSYAQGNYYTSHFGGVYVFRDVKKPTVIARGNIEGLSDLSVDNVLTFDDREGIANFLRDEGLSELIVQRRNGSSAAIIKQKIDFIIISTAATLGHDLSGVTRQSLRQLERQYAGDMPDAYFGLMDVWRWASKNGAVPKLNPAHAAYFYALRSSQHEDRDLVNMLLSDLSSLDFRQLYICHKPLFYAAYRTWSETKKEYVIKFLLEEYAVDKAAAREALFGAEPEMESAQETKKSSKSYVSPWGKSSGSSKSKSRDDDDDDDDEDDKYKRSRKGSNRKRGDKNARFRGKRH